MRKIIAYPLTVILVIVYLFWLVMFHPLQMLTYNVFGYKAHKITVDVLNWFLNKSLYLLLCKTEFKGFEDLPQGVPFIVVSNHQSMFDITPIVLGFRKHHVKFISKKELGKNIPSVSYNLQKGGSVLIDRSSGAQSIKQILMLGKKMEQNKWSASIFPEGTRSRNGQLKKFQVAGFKTLLKASPSALVVPFVIDGNYKLHKWGNFPLNFGKKLTYTALKPLNRNDFENEELLLEEVRNMIKNNLENN